jgi:SAM-dependent methyltransferase
MSEPSEMDKEFHLMIRDHIKGFLEKREHELELFNSCNRILEIGRQEHVMLHLYDTLDILAGGTFQADVTKGIPVAPSTYDVVIATEVLEHTLNPFDAIREIRIAMKPGGLLLASAPFNAREHGPLPDCWRLTRHGWRYLLRNFDDVKLDVLMTPDRPLMPLHICASARCNKEKNVQDHEMVFERQDT